jgi:hypothetical protein
VGYENIMNDFVCYCVYANRIGMLW